MMNKRITAFLIVAVLSCMFLLGACAAPVVTKIGFKDGKTSFNFTVNTFELSDLPLVVEYSNNSTKEMPVVDTMLSDEDLAALNTIGSHNITVTYRGKTANVTVKLELSWDKYARHNNDIYFGSYPQTLILNSEVTRVLNRAAGTLPTASNASNWTSYGYYINNEETNYMWYQDCEYNEQKYRGVYFTQLRPYRTSLQATTDEATAVDDNGYDIERTYWFRFEPIKWNILTEANGEALLMSSIVIDSHEFSTTEADRVIDEVAITPNNWEFSVVRSWLNDSFFNCAFTEEQKAIVLSQTLDNKTTAFGGTENIYASNVNNTTDKVFLLSYSDCVNPTFGFSEEYDTEDTKRKLLASDYAKVQGVLTDDKATYGSWLTRSATLEYSYAITSVQFGGTVALSSYCNFAALGIVPVLRIRLNSAT